MELKNVFNEIMKDPEAVYEAKDGTQRLFCMLNTEFDEPCISYGIKSFRNVKNEMHALSSGWFNYKAVLLSWKKSKLQNPYTIQEPRIERLVATQALVVIKTNGEKAALTKNAKFGVDFLEIEDKEVLEFLQDLGHVEKDSNKLEYKSFVKLLKEY